MVKIDEDDEDVVKLDDDGNVIDPTKIKNKAVAVHKAKQQAKKKAKTKKPAEMDGTTARAATEAAGTPVEAVAVDDVVAATGPRILYAAIAQRAYGTVPLRVLTQATAAEVKGNFAELAMHVLPSIPNEDARCSTPYDKWAFHFESSDDLIFFAMADQPVSPLHVFQFLEATARMFKRAYGDRSELDNFEYGFALLINYFNTEITKLRSDGGGTATLQSPSKEKLDALHDQRQKDYDALSDEEKTKRWHEQGELRSHPLARFLMSSTGVFSVAAVILAIVLAMEWNMKRGGVV
jgi:hypothetical protein